MDWLEFVQKSEWPLVVGGGLLLFRKSISELLRGMRPKKFKGFGIDAEFETSLQKAEFLTAEITPAALPTVAVPAPSQSAPVVDDLKPSPGPVDGQAPDQKALPKEHPSAGGTPPKPPTPTMITPPMGSISPVSRVLLAWGALQGQLRNYFLLLRPDLAKDKRAFHVGYIGRAIGLNDDEIAALLELRTVRNLAAHGRNHSLSDTEASRFEEVARRLTARAFDLYCESQASLSTKAEPDHLAEGRF